MITHLRGMVMEKAPTRIVIEVNGVGYELRIPLSSYDRLPPVGETALVLVHEVIREDAHELCGFLTEPERDLFRRLLDISGIGARIALGALSGLSVRQLKAAVVEGDVKRLSSISGIGKKTAERIILELKHKLSAGEALEAVAGPDQAALEDQRVRDAVEALVALGHKPADAWGLLRRILPKVGPEAGVEQLVRQALTG